jgi:multidrug resistance efflux pump
MKKHLKKFINTPRIAIGITSVLAIVIGLGSMALYRRPVAENNINVALKQSDNASINNLTLAFPVGGVIKNVYIKSGDEVKAGEVLASLDQQSARGALNQAEGTYESAKANYQKIINGATSSAIDVAKTAVNNAQSSLDNTKKVQDTLVSNAHRALLNSDLTPISNTDGVGNAPTITGTYDDAGGGSYVITTYAMGNGGYFSYSGIETGNGIISTSYPTEIGTKGLYVKFPTNYASSAGNSWTILLPNTKSSNYLDKYNNYQNALKTKDSAISSAQGVLDQAKSNLSALQVSARPEDVASAEAQVKITEGALEIAKSQINNTQIVAPKDGIITNVSITAGQIAIPNLTAIEILTK